MTPNDDPILQYYEKLVKFFGPPQHENCRCAIGPPNPPDEMDEAVAKVKARSILNSPKNRIIIPDRETILGIHMLDRDDQLRKERKDR